MIGIAMGRGGDWDPSPGSQSNGHFMSPSPVGDQKIFPSLAQWGFKIPILGPFPCPAYLPGPMARFV